MAVKREYIVKLQNKDYPLWQGILDAATEAGLVSLTTRIVQIPDDANGNYAAVVARAEFKDGRVFEDVGDCSPKSLGPRMQHLASASLRMASTRAKGRCLRDALNIGETMFEELPSDEPTVVADPEIHDLTCCQCNAAVDYGFARWSQRNYGGRVFCQPCARQLKDGVEERIAANPDALGCSGCGVQLTAAQNTISRRVYKVPLCPACQKKAGAELAKVGSRPA
jgi:hypothetical protein